jgi:hypothetical protein
VLPNIHVQPTILSLSLSLSLSLHVIMATIFRSRRASKPQLWEEGDRERQEWCEQAIHEAEYPVEVVTRVEGSLHAQPALTTPTEGG